MCLTFSVLLSITRTIAKQEEQAAQIKQQQKNMEEKVSAAEQELRLAKEKAAVKPAEVASDNRKEDEDA